MKDRRTDKELQANWLFNVWIENSQNCFRFAGLISNLISNFDTQLNSD